MFWLLNDVDWFELLADDEDDDGGDGDVLFF